MNDLIEEFIEETSDLLRDMEESLLRLEDEPDNSELINSVFRAAHTIKGTADIMGFEQIRSFTHTLESILDTFRKGKAELTKDIISVLLASQDHINNMIGDVTNEELESEEYQQRSETLINELETLLSGDQPGTNISASKTNETNKQKEIKAEPADTKVEDKEQDINADSHPEKLYVALRYNPNAFNNGIDPIAVLSYIRQIYDVISVDSDISHIPDIGSLDSTQCFMDFYIEINPDKHSINDVENSFDFIKDYCEVVISEKDNKPENSKLFLTTIMQDLNIDNSVNVNKEAQQVQETNVSISVENEKTVEKTPVANENIVKNKLAVATKKQSAKPAKRATASNNLRINADKLDELINLVGELVIASDRSKSLVHELGDKRLIESIENISGLMESIRDRTLQMRMVPIGDTFDRFQRVVRDVSNELGKDIVLVRSGGETELDKTIVERISDPLMHLIRNAIDHGIESPEERVTNGKPEFGTITLNAYHDSGGIVIEVSDDGRGLDTQKIYQKALKNGLIDDNYKMNDQEINRLIFEPGFSTREEVTNLSGRGVGMDVVKQNIESLHGHIDINTELGKGSTIILRLPLTLAVISGFMIEIDRNKYVIPLDMVQECFELTPDIYENEQFINVRGYALPVIRLRQLFQYDEHRAEEENVAVVHFAGQSVGLIVDELQGEIQTVIKPLGTIFNNLKGISGSTILGDGQVVMILDIPDLLELISGCKRQSMAYSKAFSQTEQIQAIN